VTSTLTNNIKSIHIWTLNQVFGLHQTAIYRLILHHHCAAPTRIICIFQTKYQQCWHKKTLWFDSIYIIHWIFTSSSAWQAIYSVAVHDKHSNRWAAEADVDIRLMKWYDMPPIYLSFNDHLHHRDAHTTQCHRHEMRSETTFD